MRGLFTPSGDLRLEHCYQSADGHFVIIDCIEFNDRLRFADVCADLAFLAMDLEWHGRVDLAEAFLSSYARSTGDYDLFSLVDFYSSYRAFVRAKISSMQAANTDLPMEVRERAQREARRYYLLALACERRSLQGPMLIAVGGLIASGKTTVAEAIAAKLGAPVVASDVTRKELLGEEPTTPLHDASFRGAYAPETTERVYRKLNERARAVLESGRSVILDASFRSRRSRAAVRDLAESCGASFLFVECRADPEICLARLEERAHGERPTAISVNE